MDHDAVLDSVAHWAQTEPNIRALVLEGSIAREDPSVDEWSDLDVRLYVSDPEPLLVEHDWYRQFGEVLVVEALPNPGWYPTRLVYYVDGKIDFLIAPVQSLRERQRFGRHVRVVLDKDDLTASIEQGRRVEVQVPNQAAFLVCVNEFYAAALMCARMLVRDEPIKAKVRDWDMKKRLFEMIAWDHKARYGNDRDIRPFGAQFHQWADPEIFDAFQRCWADVDPRRGIDALNATAALFVSASNGLAAATTLSPFDATAVLHEVARITTSSGTHGPN